MPKLPQNLPFRLSDVATPEGGATLVLVSPQEGSGLSKYQPIVVRTIDSSGSIRKLVLTFDFIGDEQTYLVYDGTSFHGRFADSEAQLEDDGYTFTLRRRGGWPSAPRLTYQIAQTIGSADLQAVTLDRDAKAYALAVALSSLGQVTQDRDSKAQALTAAQTSLTAVTQDRDTKAALLATANQNLATKTTQLNQQIVLANSLQTALVTMTSDRDAQLALLSTRTAERDAALANSNRRYSSSITKVWNWNGSLTPSSNWQAGYPTTIQHDPSAPYGPGLTVEMENGEPVLVCRISNNQVPVNSSYHKRAEITVSAIGGPGEVYEGEIITQECEAWFPAGFFATASNNFWFVGPFQDHQDLDLGNGGPTLSSEVHQDRIRLRLLTGFYDKTVNINGNVWGGLYPGKTGDGGVFWQSTLSTLGRGRWIKFKKQYKLSLDFMAGWVKYWVDDALVMSVFHATADVDADKDNVVGRLYADTPYRIVRSYAKFGGYQQGDVAERILRLRRLRCTKVIPVYSGWTL